MFSNWKKRLSGGWQADRRTAATTAGGPLALQFEANGARDAQLHRLPGIQTGPADDKAATSCSTPYCAAKAMAGAFVFPRICERSVPFCETNPNWLYGFLCVPIRLIGTCGDWDGFWIRGSIFRKSPPNRESSSRCGRNVGLQMMRRCLDINESVVLVGPAFVSEPIICQVPGRVSQSSTV